MLKMNLQNCFPMDEKRTFEQALAERGSFVAPASGVSMQPLIRPGRDLVEITRKGAARCRKHDVVLYRRGERYVLHRVVQVRDHDYVIAGDHQTVKEYGVTDADIVGVLSAVIRDGKRLSVTDRAYRRYVRLWCGLYPVRAACAAGKGAAVKLLRTFHSKK